MPLSKQDKLKQRVMDAKAKTPITGKAESFIEMYPEYDLKRVQNLLNFAGSDEDFTSKFEAWTKDKLINGY